METFMEFDTLYNDQQNDKNVHNECNILSRSIC